ncbi:hypothetical protein [Pseudomonas amygdali]|uniref:Uncharacterized protein n=2 Tax=Pseudomonas amygdali pv. lachrymans TaxID=53707 RepID=A0ABR5KS90_PSEAV|nr:hypothetical protein [Pseudomonas amygdali]AXH59982.1 hypothetical protein PLA107_032670 [Pseudomonas amygdali pv. lachrymans str. M301315]KPC17386.1 Uncharacterized protein AC499_0588 [Pseudomonas amygdali pv. lachrymans]RMT05820.1 hypothetical protein ALP54_03839 [Pseudomonas amygdali pv. lachrymans]
MNKPLSPSEVIESIVLDLRANDCPALQLHLDDLQESLVERIMAGDVESQGHAMAKLKKVIAIDRSLGTDALRGLLMRISIDHQTANQLISRYDCPVLNDAVCKNLMHFGLDQADGEISKYLVARNWLYKDRFELFERFATHLLNARPKDLDLQVEIVQSFTFPVANEDQKQAEVFFAWVVRHQERIIELGDSDLSSFKNYEMELGITLAKNGAESIARLLIEHGQLNPSYDDLYCARTLLGFKFSDERLLRAWDDTDTMTDEIGHLAGLTAYHLAFEDSPEPVKITGQSLNRAHAIIHALSFLEGNGIPLPGPKVAAIAGRILDEEEDPAYVQWIMEIFRDSSFHKQLLAIATYRDHSFGGDLGL